MGSLPQLLFWCVLLIAVDIQVSASMKCESQAARKGAESAQATLHKNLLCQYDTNSQPQKKMNVSIELFVRRARVVFNTLEMKVLVNLYWTDPYLVWDPAQYDDIREIQIESRRIWVPTIGAIVTLPWLREGNQEGLWPAMCHVTFNGTVACTSAMDFGGACVMSHLYWPHTRATCSAYVGMDFRVEKGVWMNFLDEAVEEELRGYVPDNDWAITQVSRSYFHLQNDPHLATTYDFNLESRGAVLSTAIIGPGIVLSVLMLGSFCLPITSQARLGLACCSTLGTVIASSILFEKLPPVKGEAPLVVTAYSGLLMLSAVAIAMTLLLNIVVPRTSKPPNPPRWLYSVQSWLTNSNLGKILLRVLFIVPHDETGTHPGAVDNLTGEKSDTSGQSDIATLPEEHCPNTPTGPHKIWDFIASFLNRCMFSIFLIACFALCLRLHFAMVTEEEL